MPATFTFGAGNARKLLRLPLYALGALAALLVPRSARLWVFGCGIGLGEGALPLYRLARERLDERTRLVWLASTDAELAEARSRGLDAVAKRSWRGFWLTLRARVVVVTHGFGDVNRYATAGAFVVQLWHGIPLKKLHLDSSATLRVRGVPDHRYVRALLARAYRFAGRGIDLFPVASELVAPRIVSAFGVRPERVVALGDIRDDALLGRAPAEVRADARMLLADAAGPIGVEHDARRIADRARGVGEQHPRV
ncbi:MAG: CDP-glycerol glycerophosphotransferase family protein, partial [Protaetiibacter sp.]